jgi:hypothetical protein
LEVIHLLRRGLERLPPEHITAVLHDPDDSMRRRYESLFGRRIRFETGGFEDWTEDIASMGRPRAASVGFSPQGSTGLT